MTEKIQRINPPELYDGEAFGISQASLDPRAGLVFLSGQVAWDQHGRVQGEGYAEQTRIALDKLRIALEASGSSFQEVLQLRVFVRGELEEHMGELVPILAEAFAGIRPALTGVGVASLATRDTLVEIEAVARATGRA
ncbi:RidA family protein [Haliangium ochraceum]|uniref:Endoribonuclease L-PSP n=1 Tax=Haliangium ochraceum (strain DSM 14365 / JCM 11303 / SMP-2) TaxID=502025 RepID=D0LUV5_HALO1|nr:RidA family protein [Haliangium ochraceum]ACY13995.1 Endoribonuclease L-PSP [Haliangium ochraceum DSM 14365]